VDIIGAQQGADPAVVVVDLKGAIGEIVGARRLERRVERQDREGEDEGSERRTISQHGPATARCRT
jgi:hypothetical protein